MPCASSPTSDLDLDLTFIPSPHENDGAEIFRTTTSKSYFRWNSKRFRVAVFRRSQRLCSTGKQKIISVRIFFFKSLVYSIMHSLPSLEPGHRQSLGSPPPIQRVCSQFFFCGHNPDGGPGSIHWHVGVRIPPPLLHPFSHGAWSPVKKSGKRRPSPRARPVRSHAAPILPPPSLSHNSQ